MKKAYQLLCVFAGLAMLCACSSDKPVFTPAPTPEFANQLQVQEVWSKSVGSGVGNYYSQLRPVVDDGQIYAASREGDIKAFDLKGHEKWHTDLTDLDDYKSFSADGNPRLSGGLLAAYGLVYVGSENAELFALDAQNGQVKWHKKMPGEVIASPSVGEGIIAVMTNNGHLVALDPSSGKKLWDIELDQPSLTLRGKAVPVISNGVVVVGRSNGSISLFSVKNGQQLFSTRLAFSQGMTQLERLVDVDSTPVIVGSDLFAVSYNGSLLAINLQSGQKSWTRSYSAYRDLTVSGNDLFMSDDRSHLIALNRFDGSEHWQQTQLEFRNLTAPAVAGQYVLVGDDQGYLYWINRDNGHFVAKEKVDSDGLYVAPVVTDHLIIIQTRSGRLVAFKRA